LHDFFFRFQAHPRQKEIIYLPLISVAIELKTLI